MVGVNGFTETAPSPLAAAEGAILTVLPDVETEQIARLQAWRAERDARRWRRARRLCAAPRERRNIMEPSIACAKAGVTTGEWGEALREVFGEYRAPTGVGPRRAQRLRGHRDVRARSRRPAQARPAARRSWSASPASTAIPTAPSRSR